MNHPMIIQAVDDVLKIYHLIGYEIFKKSVVLRYIELTRTAIMNRNDWQSAWRRCASTAWKRLKQHDDWVMVKYGVLTDIIFEGNRIVREETALKRRDNHSQ